MSVIAMAILVMMTAPPPEPPKHLLSPSVVARTLGLTVLLTHSHGGRVRLIGDSQRAILRQIRGRRPALYIPFDGHPATPFVTAHLRRERALSMGLEGCDGLPNVSVGVRAAQGFGVTVVGAPPERIRWLPADHRVPERDGQVGNPRHTVRVKGLPRPCVTVGDGEHGENVQVRLRSETADGACTMEPAGAPDQIVPWWSNDSDTTVDDVYGVLELDGGAERWLIVESGYVEARGPVVINLGGNLPTGSTNIVCGGVYVQSGADSD